MKIAILSEAFTFNPILDDLKKLGDVISYDDTTTEESMIERCFGVDIALLNCWVSPLTHNVIDGLTTVKLIVTNTTGYEQIDTSYARSKGISIANVPGFGTESVAEMVIGLMLAIDRMIPLGDNQMKKQPFWVDPQNEEMKIFKGFNLNDKTLGIIGLGAIGMRVAQLGNAFGMHVIGYNRTTKDIPFVKMMPLEDLLKESDIVSINVASTSETIGIINEKTLSLMKSNAILVNTARDNLIDVDALYSALKNGKIRGAGLDGIGLSSSDHPILKLNNLILTPHIGWYTEESGLNIAHIILDIVKAFLAGKNLHIVNLKANLS